MSHSINDVITEFTEPPQSTWTPTGKMDLDYAAWRYLTAKAHCRLKTQGIRFGRCFAQGRAIYRAIEAGGRM